MAPGDVVALDLVRGGAQGQVPLGAATFEDVRQFLEPGLASLTESTCSVAPEALWELGAMARRGRPSCL